MEGSLFSCVKDPLQGYRFVVYLNEVMLGFQKVSGISREVETEIYKEGGLNSRVHILPKCCEAERKLQLEKGSYKGMGHPFYLVGEQIVGGLNLFVMDAQGKPAKNYVFTGLTVKKWEVGAMSAEENTLLIDRFEVSYEDFEVIV